MTDIENLTEILRREREEKYSLELENAALKADLRKLRRVDIPYGFYLSKQRPRCPVCWSSDPEYGGDGCDDSCWLGQRLNEGK